ncbi:hypothetical protein [Metabacillus endolithicus]|uniref:Restriction endonuclease n=1 Tax=Metabacillus endolithicus TaxID=1535204 RepID=A0ABW5C361_9BACI|nr:hypothetical protein [Metabacillus endolithicus]UPG61679.1 hypothetical protein MVE64_13280 [Metabacillus endolithicus]
MIFRSAFNDLDTYLKENLFSITCHDLFSIKQDFYQSIETLNGSTANLTGITELLIFRHLYHTLRMNTPVLNKSVSNGKSQLSIGKRFIGKNGRPQDPDIVIEREDSITHLISIKNALATNSPKNFERDSEVIKHLMSKNGPNQVCNNGIVDIHRIDNIRHGQHKDFKSVTVVFSKVPDRHQRAINIIQEAYDWHHFIILENNTNTFIVEVRKNLTLLVPDR